MGYIQWSLRNIIITYITRSHGLHTMITKEHYNYIYNKIPWVTYNIVCNPWDLVIYINPGNLSDGGLLFWFLFYLTSCFSFLTGLPCWLNRSTNVTKHSNRDIITKFVFPICNYKGVYCVIILSSCYCSSP
jgi:hypothetical protein